MCGDQRGCSLEHLTQCLFDERFSVHIECGERIVENENGWFADDCSRKCKALALSTRDPVPLLAELGVQAIG